DILLTTPFLRVLRRRWPEAQVDFVTKARFAPLLLHNPRIDGLLTLAEPGDFRSLQRLAHQVRAARYDTIFDLHKNWRSIWLGLRSGAEVHHYRKDAVKRSLLVAFHWNLYRRVVPVRERYFLAARHWGLQDDGGPLEFYLSQGERSWAENELERLGLAGDGPLVGLAVGAGYATKRWPAEHFAALAHSLRKKRGARILLFGDVRDSVAAREIRNVEPQAVDLTGRTTLRQTAALLERCDAVVSNDSGLMHLAEAVGSRVVGIFGSTTRELGFFPTCPHCVVVERPELKCRPCSHVGRNRCPRGHFRCMRDISPRQVEQALEGLLWK
ncbi:MAG: lipopolysaccharide heptosyltransferase II, partial [Calditrichaeota bacterium]|nr:lipopolysaccharide heptosyltransferase II [Calditrichota bacterium]